MDGMDALVFWILHIMGGLFAFVMSAVSARATLTVLFVLIVELLGLFAGLFPGASGLFFTLELFGGVALIVAVPLSLGRGKLAWWFLPALAAGVFFAMRLPELVWEASVRVAVFGVLVPGVALGAGMLGGRGLAALAELGWNRVRPARTRG
jgi:hypothetical protein